MKLEDWRKEDYYWEELAYLVACPSTKPEVVKNAVRQKTGGGMHQCLRLKNRAQERVEKRINAEKTVVHRLAERVGFQPLIEECHQRAIRRSYGRSHKRGVIPVTRSFQVDMEAYRQLQEAASKPETIEYP